MSRKTIILLVFGLALLAGLAHAEEPPVPAPTDCGPVFDLAPAPAQAGICPATLATNPVPEALFGGRTCRCSCGHPCKTDADCGPGGICSGGYSCC